MTEQEWEDEFKRRDKILTSTSARLGEQFDTVVILAANTFEDGSVGSVYEVRGNHLTARGLVEEFIDKERSKCLCLE